MAMDRISSGGAQVSEIVKTFDRHQSENREVTGARPDSETLNHESMKDQKQLTRDEVKDVVKGMNEFLTPMNTSLKFQFHEKLEEYYVSIVDEKTTEVIREIPPKKLLDMYAAMTEFLGLVVDKKI